jgi:hypothetical protein
VAIAASIKAQSRDQVDRNSYSTAAVSFASNALALCFVEIAIGSGTAPAITSIAGGGMTTWTLVAEAGTGRRLSCYRALQASPGSAAAITFDLDATAALAHWSVWEVTGVATGGTNGANAIVQNDPDAGTSNTTNAGTTLAAFGSANNRPIVVVTMNANEDIGGEAGYTTVGTTAKGSGPTSGINGQFKSDGTDTTPRMTWTTSTVYRSIALELAAASTGYTLTAAQGSFSLSGQAAGLKAARKLAASQGSYALAGQAAGLKAGRKLVAAQGSYTLTGQAAGLKAGRKLSAAHGVYVLTGLDAQLVYSGGGAAYTLTAEAGSYALAGQAAQLKAGRRLAAGQGSYALAGQVAALKAARRLAAGQASYALAGQAVALKAGRKLAAGQGAYTLTGQAAALRAGRLLAAALATYTLTGFQVILAYSAAEPPPADRLFVVGAEGRLFVTPAESRQFVAPPTQ